MFKGGDRKPTLAHLQSSTQYPQSGGLKYPLPLNFYDRPPLFDVTIEEFETCALDRLRILAEIESSAARNRTWDELKKVIDAQCEKYMPLKDNSSTADKDGQRRRDHLSHFVLRLAFCRSEDLRRRYVKAETQLFKLRYEASTNADKEAFLASRDFNYLPVNSEEKAKYSNELYSLYYNPRPEAEKRSAFEKEKYLKVRWSRVPDLVEKRRVLLRGGWAYVPGMEQSSIVYQEFETKLEKVLEVTARLLPRLDEDDRLIPILENLAQGFLAGVPSEWVGEGAQAGGEELKAEMIDELSKKHFPMCMKTLHDKLNRDRHLKHFGRLQYGLFLKACPSRQVLGLSVEEAVAFWRKSFNKITDDKFNKEYKYNIRHSYGLEGKRANYPAKNCLQILSPGNMDGCGCPYRTYSPENLQSALLSAYAPLGLKASDLPEIMDTVDKKHFHVACTRVFEITHGNYGVKKGEGIGSGESVTHPNQYAARSRELKKAADGDTEMASELLMTSRKTSTKPAASTAADEDIMHQYQDTDGHFSLVRNFRLADMVTIMNGVCGSLSIFSSAHYLLTNDTDYLWSALSLPLAGLMFDFLDGKVARWRKSTSLLGQELDSLADLISFGVAPALLAFTVGLRTYLDTVFLTGFICCGLARLARFNATVALIPKEKGKAKYFEGLPIPSSLGLVAVIAYLAKLGWIEGQAGLPLGTMVVWGAAGGRGEVHVISVVFGLWAAAMVSKTLRVPKI